MDIHKLNDLYQKAEEADKKIFAEMRSNVLLVAGEHYNKAGSKFFDRIAGAKDVNDEIKIRLVKNHVSALVEKRTNRLLSIAGSTTIVPNNEDEIQDQKAAELHKAVWHYYRKHSNLEEKIEQLAEDFVQLGECFIKIYWDEDKGKVLGYEPKLDAETEEELKDESGRPIPDKKKPVMSGDFVFERVLAFDVLRDPSAKSMEESEFLIVKHMIDKSEAIKMVGDDQSKIRALSNVKGNTFLVFNNSDASYSKQGNKILVKEFYFKPSKKYPKGKYVLIAGDVELASGNLPYGIFPILYAGYNNMVTTPRHYSDIRKIRPYQIEINRTASKIAETQMTIGDDKLIIFNGSKISSGGRLSGVRAIKVMGGKEPTILPGRSGEQYANYMANQIQEMYNLFGDEMDNSEENFKMDSYALLYKNLKNRTRISRHANKFSRFLRNITETFLKLAKHYLDEQAVIPMIGKSEIVNISEFKNAEDIRHQIIIEETNKDIDTMLGKQLAITQTLQYVGNQLEPNDIAMLMKAMPFMNEKEAFDGLGVDYDMAKNDMLAMERGVLPQIRKYDNHKYLIKMATNRVKKPDFQLLPQQIQEIYHQYIDNHEQAAAMEMQEQQRMKEGFIPTDGPLVGADYYIVTEDGKTKRVKMPQRALEWLREQLAAQGTSLEYLMSGNPEVAKDTFNKMQQSTGQPNPPSPAPVNNPVDPGQLQQEGNINNQIMQSNNVRQV